MEKKKFAWLKLIATVIPLLAFLIFVNTFFDPANIFHNVSRSLADSLLNGNPTYIASGNMDERRVKQYIIEDMPDRVDCLVVGSSTVFGIRKEHTGADSFYNLCVSGADFYDIMAQFGTMELNSKSADRIIISLDPYFFSDYLNETFTRNIPLKPYSNYMLAVLDNQTPDIPERDSRAEDKQRILQMFSVTYFQASVDYILSNGSLNIPRWGIASPGHTGAYYLPDGSMIYPTDMNQSDVDAVLRDASAYQVNYNFSAHEHMSTSKKESFEKLLDYLKARGTTVTFYLAPMSPSLWDRCDESIHPLLWEIEAYAHEIAAEHNMNVVGSYNPYNLGLTDEDFYDARHLHHSWLAENFDFKP